MVDRQIQRVLVVTAHPDDVDFGSAGTIANWTDDGVYVAYCIVTDGDAGGFDPGVAINASPESPKPGVPPSFTPAIKSLAIQLPHTLTEPICALPFTCVTEPDWSWS